MRIAIFGQKEHGKTTLAKIIQKQYYEQRQKSKFLPEYDSVSIVSLSNPLKEILALASGKSVEWLMNSKTIVPQNWRMIVREGMQKLSDCMKEIVNENVLLDRITEVKEFIIDDGRYLNELIGLKDSTFCILLYRPSHLNVDPHSSESWLRSLYHDYDIYFNETLKDFNLVILNNGTLEDLKKKISDEILPQYFIWERENKNGD